MPRTQGDEEQEHEEGNPHAGKDEKDATDGGLSEKDMTEFFSFFSGEEKDSYDLWKYEVICLMKESDSESLFFKLLGL